MVRIFRSNAFGAALSALLIGLPPALAGAETADETTAKLCPILADVAAGPSDAAPEFAQMALVMSVAEAYDYDHERLMAVLADADAATTAACPEDRDAALKAVNLPTLAEAMR